MNRMGLRYGIPAALAAILASALVHGQEGKGRLQVRRFTEADGTNAQPVDLGRIADHYDRTMERLRRAVAGLKTRVDQVKETGHHAGLPGCKARDDRRVRLDETVPARYRDRTLYFVHVRRGGIRSGILPPTLPESSDVFVLDADRLSDVTALARVLGRRVTLASAEFARAVGVRCEDARITFSLDGTTALVHEEAP